MGLLDTPVPGVYMYKHVGIYVVLCRVREDDALALAGFCLSLLGVAEG